MLLDIVNPTDHGPIYFETNLDRFPVEPWNAFSSLSFFIPAILFIIYINKKNGYTFFKYWAVPLLIIGGIGSTLFHAYRSSIVFILIDVVPVALLSLSIAAYQIYLLIKKWLIVSIICILFVVLRQIPFLMHEGQTAINISYIISGLFFFIPTLILLKKTFFVAQKCIYLSIAFFILAIFFRYYDDMQTQFLPMGVHWLWHIMTAFGTYFLGMFLFKTKERLITVTT